VVQDLSEEREQAVMKLFENMYLDEKAMMDPQIALPRLLTEGVC
jgi:hypothetical protein